MLRFVILASYNGQADRENRLSPADGPRSETPLSIPNGNIVSPFYCFSLAFKSVVLMEISQVFFTALALPLTS